MMQDSFSQPPSSFDPPPQPEEQVPVLIPPPSKQRKQTCDIAIAAMILGIIAAFYSFFCIGFPFAIAAIVCGHIARSQIRNRNLAGNGFALTGLIAGYLILVFSILLGIILVCAVFMQAARPEHHAPPSPEPDFFIDNQQESAESLQSKDY